MPKRINCPLCQRNDFASTESLINHIKSQHVGKLSESSVRYLLSQGVKPDRIIQFCKENRIKVDTSMVYRVAVRMVKEGEL